MDELKNNELNFMKVIGSFFSDIGDSVNINENDVIEIIELANKHKLLPLGYEGISKYADEETRNAASAYKSICAATIINQAKRTDFFMTVYSKLEEKGLAPIVLKGVICRQLYGKYANHRPSGDEDLLVKKELFFETKQVLEECGFVCELDKVTEEKVNNAQEISFYHPMVGLNLEVHINLFGCYDNICAYFNTFFEQPFERTESVLVKSFSREMNMITFAPTDGLLFLVLHFVKHLYSEGVGVRQLLDIALFYRKYENEINYNVFFEKLESTKTRLIFNDILAVANKYLGFEFELTAEPINIEFFLKILLDNGVFGYDKIAVPSKKVALRAVYDVDYNQNGILTFIHFQKAKIRQLFRWTQTAISILLEKKCNSETKQETLSRKFKRRDRRKNIYNQVVKVTDAQYNLLEMYQFFESKKSR